MVRHFYRDTPRHILFVTAEGRPVVLVHGWKSYPGIWDQLVERLADRPVPCWAFDHSRMRGAGPETTAGSLQEFLWERREETGFFGPVDRVCHFHGNRHREVPARGRGRRITDGEGPAADRPRAAQ